MKNKVVSVECFESFLVLKWEDGGDDCLSLPVLRAACPCAFCSGETDVFGNKYVGDKKDLSLKGVVLKGYAFVGLYALRLIWGDGHSDGLYTFDLLKKITLQLNEK